MNPADNQHYLHIVVDGQRIECCRIGDPGSGQTDSAPTLVFLHEGLGSIAMWRGFPERVCEAAGLPGLVYSRLGYGSSDPVVEARTARFMHDEAVHVLPQVLASFGIERPILIGHSDGASIALIHAGVFPEADAGVAVLAPHLFVEPVCTDAIEKIARRYETSALRASLARYHADVDGAFQRWTEVWLSDAFAAWSIEKEVASIRCPLLAIQGENDEYGTMRQLERLTELATQTRVLKLPDCRHSPHLDRPDEVASALVAFCADVVAGRAPPAPAPADGAPDSR